LEFQEQQEDSTVPSTGSPANSDYEYDVFISYRHKDRHWVRETLLPRLRSWGVSYCVDFEMFAEGIPFEQEMNRLIQRSRQTLVVLTGGWLESPFTTFEADASAGRVIVLRIDESALPAFPSGSKVIDLTRINIDKEWTALKLAILGAKVKSLGRSLPRVYASFFRALMPQSESAASRYAIAIEVENHSDSEINFDNMVLEFTRPPSEHYTRWTVDTLHVVFDGEGVYVRPGPVSRYSDPGGVLAKLAPGSGIQIPELPLPRIPETVPGKYVIELSITLAMGHVRVTEPCVCPLPPATRISRLRHEDDRIWCPPADRLPVPSKILDPEVRSAVFHSARSYAADALLHTVTPWQISVNGINHPYAALYSATDWNCTFSSEAKNCTFAIPVNDPGWIGEENVRLGHLRADTWLSEHHLDACGVDSRLAFLIGLHAGCRPPDWISSREPGGHMRHLERLALVMREVSGKWKCLWLLPFVHNGETPAAIEATSGEVCEFRDGRWSSRRGMIWNLQAYPRELS
jgi:hypothetical protein